MRLEELEISLRVVEREIAEAREKDRVEALRLSATNKLAAALNEAVEKLLTPEERKLLAGKAITLEILPEKEVRRCPGT